MKAYKKEADLVKDSINSILFDEKKGYYINFVKCAILEENPKKAADLIVDFYKNPQKLDVYKQNAINHHDYFGAEKTADILFEEICKKFKLK